ncbi:MAG: hypothetical protein ABEJ83_01020 [Candidatus Nanohaloarchaea archaeon]
MSEDSASYSKTVGDMQIGTATSLRNRETFALMVSRQGIKKQVDFTFDVYDPDNLNPEQLGDFPEKFKELEDEADASEILWKCKRCGDLYAVKGIREPEKCECGSKGFIVEGEYPTVEKELGPILLTAYEKENDLVFEFRNKKEGRGELFYEVNDKFGRIVKAFREIEEKRDQLDEENRESDVEEIESGVSSETRNRLQHIKAIIGEETDGRNDSVPIEEVKEIAAEDQDIDPEKTEEIIEKLKREGELFEPKEDQVQKI